MTGFGDRGNLTIVMNTTSSTAKQATHHLQRCSVHLVGRFSCAVGNLAVRHSQGDWTFRHDGCPAACVLSGCRLRLRRRTESGNARCESYHPAFDVSWQPRIVQRGGSVRAGRCLRVLDLREHRLQTQDSDMPILAKLHSGHSPWRDNPGIHGMGTSGFSSVVERLATSARRPRFDSGACSFRSSSGAPHHSSTGTDSRERASRRCLNHPVVVGSFVSVCRFREDEKPTCCCGVLSCVIVSRDCRLHSCPDLVVKTVRFRRSGPCARLGNFNPRKSGD